MGNRPIEQEAVGSWRLAESRNEGEIGRTGERATKCRRGEEAQGAAAHGREEAWA